MEHELKHVRTFREFLPDAAEEIEAALRVQFGNRVQYFASEAAANAHVEHVTREFLAPFVTESMARVRGLQAQVDSPEEYARMQIAHDACREKNQIAATATR